MPSPDPVDPRVEAIKNALIERRRPWGYGNVVMEAKIAYEAQDDAETAVRALDALPSASARPDPTGELLCVTDRVPTGRSDRREGAAATDDALPSDRQGEGREQGDPDGYLRARGVLRREPGEPRAEERVRRMRDGADRQGDDELREDEWQYTEEPADPDDPIIAGPRFKRERDELRKENERLRADNERLREALDKLTAETSRGVLYAPGIERLTRERDEARAAIVPPVSVTGSSQTGVGGLPADLVGALAAAEARERALREALQRIIAIEQGEIATKEELALALNRCGDIAQDALAAALASPETEGEAMSKHPPAVDTEAIRAAERCARPSP